MAAIPFDGLGFSKGGHIIFLRGMAPIEDAVRPRQLLPSITSRSSVSFSANEIRTVIFLMVSGSLPWLESVTARR